MRLDRLLSQAGLGTRREVKKMIQAGKVTVNGDVIKRPNVHVDFSNDEIMYLDQPVHYQPYYYIMLNKPDGLVSATHDNLYETVIEWVELDYYHVDLFPVGRLDVDTTGLLLLTNNGQLAHQLTSPRREVPKVYHAIVDGVPGEDAFQQFQAGIDLGDFVTLPAELKVIDLFEEDGQSEVEVVITEGKFHQVKRMMEAVGHPVQALHRLSVGPITLDENLMLGEYRELTPEEMTLLEPYGLRYE